VERRAAATDIVYVTHHPDVTLEEELRVRVALSEDLLFDAVYTADPPSLPDGAAD